MPREHILVVDDSPTILKLVQLALTKADYLVTTASDGPGAIAAARETHPDLVLLDWMLPAMDGAAICAALAEEPGLGDVPVVLVSAHADEIETRGRKLGNVVDAISKPFTPDALLTVVAHSLEKRRGQAAVAEAVDADLGSLSLVPETGVTTELSGAALAGDIAVVSIADIFTLLQDEGQTGILTVSRDDARLRICLRDGRIDFATAEGVPEDFLLGRFLVRAGAIDREALAAFVEKRKGQQGGALLGADLLSQGLLTPESLKKAVSLQTSALVFESLRWGAGRLVFEATAELPDAAKEAALALPVDALLMEGFRRVDEWRLIEREVGDFDRVFVRDEDKIAGFGRARLTREEMLVLDLVNGRNSVRDVIQLSHMGSFDATKMLYRLLRTKLIRRRVTPIAV